jgi:hypothetical protein
VTGSVTPSPVSAAAVVKHGHARKAFALATGSAIGVLFLGMPLLSPIAFVVVLVYVCLKDREAIREDWREARTPCDHGVAGAAASPVLCMTCVQDAAGRAQREREAAAARELERVRTAKAAMLEKLRVPQYLASMPPDEFESLVCDVYRKLGYEVRATPYVGDGGIDAFLSKDGKRFVVQCKRVRTAVGEPVVRDLFGAMHHVHSDGAIVVTTGSISDQARRWARGKPIEFVDEGRLTAMVRSVYPDAELVPAKFRATNRREAGRKSRTCPICARPLRRRSGRFGYFIGCTGYPSCRYTRPTKRR